MYKIKNLEIKDFRAFRDQKIEIPSPAQIILITGNNGLGKTFFLMQSNGDLQDLSGVMKKKAEKKIKKYL